jgi:5-methylcytosine-specific restriction endonuclease McrA
MPYKPKTFSERRKKSVPRLKRKTSEHDSLRNCKRWVTLSRQVRVEQPMCFDPYGNHKRTGELKASEEVHHIKPLHTHPELAYVKSNLVGLCQKCHAKVDALYLKEPERSVNLFYKGQEG